jgi:hypothetical protein
LCLSTPSATLRLAGTATRAIYRHRCTFISLSTHEGVFI